MEAGQPAPEAVADLLWTCTALSVPLAVGLTASRLRGRAQAAEARTRTLEQEQQALAEAAADEERRRIARELHDVVSHSLGVVVVLQAGAAEQVLDRDPDKTREALHLIRSIGQQAIAEMGTLVRLIRATTAPAPVRAPAPGAAFSGCASGSPCSAASCRPGATPAAVGSSARPSRPRHDPGPAR